MKSNKLDLRVRYFENRNLTESNKSLAKNLEILSEKSEIRSQIYDLSESELVDYVFELKVRIKKLE